MDCWRLPANVWGFAAFAMPFVRAALLLTAIHVGLAPAAGGTLATLLGRSRPRRILEGLTGAALLALAIGLLT